MADNGLHAPRLSYLSSIETIADNCETSQLGRGNLVEVMAHWNAIDRIVKLRGGIEAFANNKHVQLKLAMYNTRSPLL